MRLICLFVSILVLFPGCSRPTPVPEPEPPVASTPASDEEAEVVEESDWFVDLPSACAEAKKTGRPIFALFTGSTWCPPCQYLEKTVLRKKLFADFAKEHIVLLKFDIPYGGNYKTDTERRAGAAHAKYRIRGVPTVLLLDADGKELKHTRFYPETVRTYLEDLRKALDEIAKEK